MKTELARHLRLEGTRNLRDIGGYPTDDGRRTRWRTVFRSDCLDQLPPTSQSQLLALGVRTIVDIRDYIEVRDRPNVFATSAHVAYRWLPLWDQPLPPGSVPDPTADYRRDFDLRGEQLVAICRELLRPASLPGLIHCSGGKDRTGVVIALLLATARVLPEVIAQDYALSDTPAERMVTTLEYLSDRWGGAEKYLEQHGLTKEEISELYARLTETAG